MLPSPNVNAKIFSLLNQLDTLLTDAFGDDMIAQKQEASQIIKEVYSLVSSGECVLGKENGNYINSTDSNKTNRRRVESVGKSKYLKTKQPLLANSFDADITAMSVVADVVNAPVLDNMDSVGNPGLMDDSTLDEKNTSLSDVPLSNLSVDDCVMVEDFESEFSCGVLHWEPNASPPMKVVSHHVVTPLDIPSPTTTDPTPSNSMLVEQELLSAPSTASTDFAALSPLATPENVPAPACRSRRRKSISVAKLKASVTEDVAVRTSGRRRNTKASSSIVEKVKSPMKHVAVASPIKCTVPPVVPSNAALESLQSEPHFEEDVSYGGVLEWEGSSNSVSLNVDVASSMEVPSDGLVRSSNVLEEATAQTTKTSRSCLKGAAEKMVVELNNSMVNVSKLELGIAQDMLCGIPGRSSNSLIPIALTVAISRKMPMLEANGISSENITLLFAQIVNPLFSADADAVLNQTILLLSDQSAGLSTLSTESSVLDSMSHNKKKKSVSFNPIDGSQLSPPNDNTDWKLWNASKQLGTQYGHLLSFWNNMVRSLHYLLKRDIAKFRLMESLFFDTLRELTSAGNAILTEVMNMTTAYCHGTMSMATNCIKLVLMLQLTSSNESLAASLSYHGSSIMLDRNSFYCSTYCDGIFSSVLQMRFSWILTSSIRCHMRYLFDHGRSSSDYDVLVSNLASSSSATDLHRSAVEISKNVKGEVMEDLPWSYLFNQALRQWYSFCREISLQSNAIFDDERNFCIASELVDEWTEVVSHPEIYSISKRIAVVQMVGAAEASRRYLCSAFKSPSFTAANHNHQVKYLWGCVETLALSLSRHAAAEDAHFAMLYNIDRLQMSVNKDLFPTVLLDRCRTITSQFQKKKYVDKRGVVKAIPKADIVAIESILSFDIIEFPAGMTLNT